MKNIDGFSLFIVGVTLFLSSLIVYGTALTFIHSDIYLAVAISKLAVTIAFVGAFFGLGGVTWVFVDDLRGIHK